MYSNTNTTTTQEKEIVLNSIYVLKKKLGAGSFGAVYQTCNKKTGELYATKIEKNEDKDQCSILYEAACLSRLQGIKGFPKLFWSGSQDKYDAMVISLLGKDIGSYAKIFKKLSLKTVVNIMDQCIGLIQHMHNRNLVHRDIKPENMAVGRNEDNNQIFFIDFGISKIFRDDKGRHICFREGKPFIGTTRYAAIASHRGHEISRKDDLESIGYVMVYLLKGQLPWQNMQVKEKEKNKKVGEMKQAYYGERLCEGLEEQFTEYFNYLRSLKFTDDPDYNYLRDLVQDIAKNHNFEIDGEFEWARPLKLAVNKNRSDIKKHTFNVSIQPDSIPKNFLSPNNLVRNEGGKNPTIISIGSIQKTGRSSIRNRGRTVLLTPSRGSEQIYEEEQEDDENEQMGLFNKK